MQNVNNNNFLWRKRMEPLSEQRCMFVNFFHWIGKKDSFTIETIQWNCFGGSGVHCKGRNEKGKYKILQCKYANWNWRFLLLYNDYHLHYNNDIQIRPIFFYIQELRVIGTNTIVQCVQELEKHNNNNNYVIWIWNMEYMVDDFGLKLNTGLVFLSFSFSII